MRNADDFGFSQAQVEFGAAARRFAHDILKPQAREREVEGAVSPVLRRQMGDLGLICAELPERFGGLGASYATSGAVLEAVAEGDFNVAYVQLLGSLCGAIIARHAEDAVAREILPRVCRGEVLVALALTEPQAGSDAAAVKLRAVRDGEAYVLSGEKTSISMADQADYAIVFARTGAAEERGRGVSAFLVDLLAAGVSRTRFDDVGQKAVGRGSIFFDQVRTPVHLRLGAEGDGFVQVMQGFDFSRALIGLQCLSAARQSLQETWRYAADRHAFGRPLSDNQGVTFPLAEHDTHVEAARWLCYRTLALKDAGVAHTREAAMCKWWGPKLAFDVIHQCLLTHGHAGYSADLPFEQRLRDVLGLQIGDGTAQIMKLVIARENLRSA